MTVERKKLQAMLLQLTLALRNTPHWTSVETTDQFTFYRGMSGGWTFLVLIPREDQTPADGTATGTWPPGSHKTTVVHLRPELSRLAAQLIQQKSK